MNSDMQKRALAAREAHLALLDLKRVVEEAVETTHAAELEAVALAIRPRAEDDVASKVRTALEKLASADFERSLSAARQNLQVAMA